MDPAIIAAAAAALWVLFRPREGRDEDRPPAPPPLYQRRSPVLAEDVGEAGSVADPTAQRDSRQLIGGREIAPGGYVDGQTIETALAVPYAAFYGAKSNYTEHSPIAEGANAPSWGACGMPGVYDRGNGAVPVPEDANVRRRQSILSNYAQCKLPRKKGSSFSGVVARPVNGGRPPSWLPQDPTTHEAYREGGGRNDNPGVNGRIPDAGPVEGQVHSGTTKRLRGLRTPEGLPMVLAEDSRNFSALNLSASAAETAAGSRYRLFVGAGQWTALEIGRNGKVTQLSRREAQRRLGWVVPGMLDRIERHNDRSERTIRGRIVESGGGFPLGDPWLCPPYAAYNENVSDPAQILPGERRRGTRIPADTPQNPSPGAFTLGAVGDPGTRYFFPVTRQNLVEPAVAWWCNSRDRDDCTESLYDELPRNSTQRVTPALSVRNRGQTPTFAVAGRWGKYGKFGPLYWARGTASQYRGQKSDDPNRRPMIPFPLEAPLLLAALGHRNYVRVVRFDPVRAALEILSE